MALMEREAQIYNCLTQVDEAWIEEAAEGLPARKAPVGRWCAMAACLLLAAGLGWASLSGMDLGLNTSGGAGLQAGMPAQPGSGLLGSADATAGAPSNGVNLEKGETSGVSQPMLTLTVANQTDGVSAQRELTLDFADWQEGEGLVRVADAYVLHNSSEENVVCMAAYPVVSTLEAWEGAEATLQGAGGETLLLGADLTALSSDAVYSQALSLPADAGTSEMGAREMAVYTIHAPSGLSESAEVVLTVSHGREELAIYQGASATEGEECVTVHFPAGAALEGSFLALDAGSPTPQAEVRLADGAGEPAQVELERTDMTLEELIVQLSRSEAAGNGDWDEPLLVQGALGLLAAEPGVYSGSGLLQATLGREHLFWLTVPVEIPSGESRTVTAVWRCQGMEETDSVWSYAIGTAQGELPLTTQLVQLEHTASVQLEGDGLDVSADAVRLSGTGEACRLTVTARK